MNSLTAVGAAPLTLDAARAKLAQLCGLSVLDCGSTAFGHRIQAIYGPPAMESSFKAILGLGLLILARERSLLSPGQPVIESSSGSLGVGLALAGRLLGHRVHIVTDASVPEASRAKMMILGADVQLVHDPHPRLGFQESRDQRLGELCAAHPDWYWTDQNNSDLNPEVYRRWLIPAVTPQLDLSQVAAGIFCVGSGGHFTAFGELLAGRGLPSYVADRIGSITFGGAPGPSRLRGTGNQNRIPDVMARAMGLVSGVYRVSDAEAVDAMRDLLRTGISAGGSAGVCWAGAHQLSADLAPTEGRDTILTFFADRGELYPNLLTEALSQSQSTVPAGSLNPATCED